MIFDLWIILDQTNVYFLDSSFRMSDLLWPTIRGQLWISVWCVPLLLPLSPIYCHFQIKSKSHKIILKKDKDDRWKKIQYTTFLLTVSNYRETPTLKPTKLFSFQASGNLGRCFSLETRTCMSSNVGWFPASAWKAIWYSGTDSPGCRTGRGGMSYFNFAKILIKHMNVLSYYDKWGWMAYYCAVC